MANTYVEKLFTVKHECDSFLILTLLCLIKHEMFLFGGYGFSLIRYKLFCFIYILKLALILCNANGRLGFMNGRIFLEQLWDI